jgi:hypothetical protein
MRVGCKVEVKVKLDVKANYWYYEIVSLKHNHRMNPKTEWYAWINESNACYDPC